jgi:hypothetical protein
MLLSYRRLSSVTGLLLSIEVYDPGNGFTFASAIGPAKLAAADDDDDGNVVKVLTLDPKGEGTAIVTNPFCAAREDWEGWEFENMRQYLEALNRPHPDAAAGIDDNEDGPAMTVRMVITNTDTGRSEVLANISPTFEVEASLDDDSFTCTGLWRTLVSPRWAGDILEVRLVLRPEPGPQGAGELLECDRMYTLQSSSEEVMDFVGLEVRLDSQAKVAARIHALVD